MAQAILITAYKNIDQIRNIIDFFDDSFNFYIHIDKKSNIEINDFGNKSKNVFVYKRFNVNWGGVNHLKSILYLSDEALKNPENIFFHLITGEDFPLKPTSFFVGDLDKSQDYLSYSPLLPASGWLNRTDYFHFVDIIDVKKNIILQKINGLMVAIQKLFKLKRRKIKDFSLFGGSTYWSLTRNTLLYVIDFTNNNSYLFKRVHYSFCPEEMYFQTVLMNSDFNKNIVNDNLRYIDWSEKKSGPSYIDKIKFDEVYNSNKIWGRKFSLKTSDIYKDYLKAKLVNV